MTERMTEDQKLKLVTQPASEALTPEQKQDLDEAVQAAITASKDVEAVKELANKIRKDLQGLFNRVVELCGGPEVKSGALAYCRGKAIEKLEECGHRVNDAVQAKIDMLEQNEEQQAVNKAMSTPGGLKVI